MAALLLDWLFCLVRVMVRRRLRHIPRKQLVWDIAGICTGDALPYRLERRGSCSGISQKQGQCFPGT